MCGVPAEEISGNDLLKITKSSFSCNICECQRASRRSDNVIGWVNCPLRKKSEKFICSLCCLDISGTCILEDFESHPYRDIVEDVAKKSQSSVNQVRRICLEHQLENLEKYESAGSTDEEKLDNAATREHIQKLISSLY